MIAFICLVASCRVRCGCIEMVNSSFLVMNSEFGKWDNVQDRDSQLYKKEINNWSHVLDVAS